MKQKFYVLMILWAVALSGAASAQTNSATGVQTARLVNSLPASDGAMTFNVQRFLSEALPQTLSGNQQMITKILGGIDQLKDKTGVDLRQFETVAVGVSSRKSAAGELDFEPVVLARGSFNAASFITLAKIALNSKYREEKIGGRTVYIFSPKALIKTIPLPRKPQSKMTSAFERALDRMFERLENEFAVAAFDNNTLAIGSAVRLRETFGASQRIGGEVLDLINRKPNAVANFSLKLPGGLSSFMKLNNDELGKNLDAVRFISGAIDTSDGSALVSVTAKTAAPEQARGLQELLSTLQSFGKSFIGGSKIDGKEIYARMIENARIGNNADEVSLDLSVPQSDINALLDKFAKPKVKTISPK